MNRSGRLKTYKKLERRTPLRSQGTPLKRSQAGRIEPGARKALRSTLRAIAKDGPARAKLRIQALLREIVILRDGGCILRKYRHCNDPVLQADHLITRANSATYADTRLVVCVCRTCHGWKSVGSNRNKEQYDALVRSILSPDRAALWDRCKEESWRPSRKYASDWTLAELALQKELRTLKAQQHN